TRSTTSSSASMVTPAYRASRRAAWQVPLVTGPLTTNGAPRSAYKLQDTPVCVIRQGDAFVSSWTAWKRAGRGSQGPLPGCGRSAAVARLQLPTAGRALAPSRWVRRTSVAAQAGEAREGHVGAGAARRVAGVLRAARGADVLGAVDGQR